MITKTPTENIVGVFVNLNDKLGFSEQFVSTNSSYCFVHLFKGGAPRIVEPAA